MESVNKHRNENPSFSSTLLDIIYRSIDERDNEHSLVYLNSLKKRQSVDSCCHIDKQNIDSVSIRRKSAATFENGSNKIETIYRFPARPKLKPNPIRVREETQNYQDFDMHLHDKHENMFVKKKSKAKKIYGYLKKGKQPVSPGGRLTCFILSLFSNENKTSKITCTGSHDEVIIQPKCKPRSKSVNCSITSSSACSFSRTCLNKSRVINNHVIEESRMDLLKSFRKKVECVLDLIGNNVTKNDEDEDEDDASYASSDLFELDHLSTIGIETCMQELPLYETTSDDVNRAIANGVLV